MGKEKELCVVMLWKRGVGASGGAVCRVRVAIVLGVRVLFFCPSLISISMLHRQWSPDATILSPMLKFAYGMQFPSPDSLR
jgi:hypothetical protein